MKDIDNKTLGKLILTGIWIFYRAILHIFRIKPYPKDNER